VDHGLKIGTGINFAPSTICYMDEQFPVCAGCGEIKMKLLHALTLFATLGLALARDFFEQLGFHADLPVIGALGLAMTTLLIFRGLVPLLAVTILLVLVRMPEILTQYNLDPDVLLASAMCIVLYPWLKRIASGD
jgi:hypothetical protein